MQSLVQAGDLNQAADVGAAAVSASARLGATGTDEHLRLAATLVGVHIQRGDLLYAQHLAEEMLQDAEQVLVANDLSVADQWIGQQVEVGQSGSADAMSSQKHATLTGTGKHEASGRASSDIESDITQRGFQGGLVDGG